MPNFHRPLVRRVLCPRRTLAAALVAAITFGAVPAVAATAAGSQTAVPSYDHVFLIVEENNGFSDVIGNAAAPNLNSYAKHFGTATLYYGVNGTSEPNYVGMLGGSTFGLNSDDAYWKNAVIGPEPRQRAGQGWGQLEGLPPGPAPPGFEDICSRPSATARPTRIRCTSRSTTGSRISRTSLNSFDWSHQVPVQDLTADLASGNVPRFSYIVPDECHDMHGDPPYCLDSGNEGDLQNQHLIATGDAYLGGLVSAHHQLRVGRGTTPSSSPTTAGNNARAAAMLARRRPGCRGRHHEPRPEGNPMRPFEPLLDAEHAAEPSACVPAVHLRHGQRAADAASLRGQRIARRRHETSRHPTTRRRPRRRPNTVFATTATAGVRRMDRPGGPAVGQSDNSLGGVAASSPNDVWAVGDFLPDAAGATRTPRSPWPSTATVHVVGGADTECRAELRLLLRCRGEPGSGVGRRRTSERRLRGPGPRRVVERHRVEHRPRAATGSPTRHALRRLLHVAVGRVGRRDKKRTVGASKPWPSTGTARHGRWCRRATRAPTTTSFTASSRARGRRVGRRAAARRHQPGPRPRRALGRHVVGVPTPVEKSGTTMFNAVTAQGPDVWAVGQVDSPGAEGGP